VITITITAPTLKEAKELSLSLIQAEDLMPHKIKAAKTDEGLIEITITVEKETMT
jgi:hypothetical protein